MITLLLIATAIILFLTGLEITLDASNMALDRKADNYIAERKEATSKLCVGVGFVIFSVLLLTISIILG